MGASSIDDFLRPVFQNSAITNLLLGAPTEEFKLQTTDPSDLNAFGKPLDRGSADREVLDEHRAGDAKDGDSNDDFSMTQDETGAD